MADLIDVILRWNGEGRTVIAVLHDQEIVRMHFPDTLLLARELIAYGLSTEEVLTAENQFKARQMCEACEGPAARLRARCSVIVEAIFHPFMEFGFMCGGRYWGVLPFRSVQLLWEYSWMC